MVNLRKAGRPKLAASLEAVSVAGPSLPSEHHGLGSETAAAEEGAWGQTPVAHEPVSVRLSRERATAERETPASTWADDDEMDYSSVPVFGDGIGATAPLPLPSQCKEEDEEDEDEAAPRGFPASRRRPSSRPSQSPATLPQPLQEKQHTASGSAPDKEASAREQSAGVADESKRRSSIPTAPQHESQDVRGRVPDSRPLNLPAPSTEAWRKPHTLYQPPSHHASHPHRPSDPNHPRDWQRDTFQSPHDTGGPHDTSGPYDAHRLPLHGAPPPPRDFARRRVSVDTPSDQAETWRRAPAPIPAREEPVAPAPSWRREEVTGRKQRRASEAGSAEKKGAPVGVVQGGEEEISWRRRESVTPPSSAVLTRPLTAPSSTGKRGSPATSPQVPAAAASTVHTTEDTTSPHVSSSSVTTDHVWRKDGGGVDRRSTEKVVILKKDSAAATEVPSVSNGVHSSSKPVPPNAWGKSKPHTFMPAMRPTEPSTQVAPPPAVILKKSPKVEAQQVSAPTSASGASKSNTSSSSDTPSPPDLPTNKPSASPHLIQQQQQQQYHYKSENLTVPQIDAVMLNIRKLIAEGESKKQTEATAEKEQPIRTQKPEKVVLSEKIFTLTEEVVASFDGAPLPAAASPTPKSSLPTPHPPALTQSQESHPVSPLLRTPMLQHPLPIGSLVYPLPPQLWMPREALPIVHPYYTLGAQIYAVKDATAVEAGLAGHPWNVAYALPIVGTSRFLRGV